MIDDTVHLKEDGFRAVAQHCKRAAMAAGPYRHLAARPERQPAGTKAPER